MSSVQLCKTLTLNERLSYNWSLLADWNWFFNSEMTKTITNKWAINYKLRTVLQNINYNIVLLTWLAPNDNVSFSTVYAKKIISFFHISIYSSRTKAMCHETKVIFTFWLFHISDGLKLTVRALQTLISILTEIHNVS